MAAAKRSKWPDFLFTVAVRFGCGVILGGLACFVFGWRGILRAFSHNNTPAPLIWLGFCALAGGIISVFTVPRWQTPWYKRESDVITSEIVSRESTSVYKIIDESGVERTYHSLDEMPPELRAAVEAAEKSGRSATN